MEEQFGSKDFIMALSKVDIEKLTEYASHNKSKKSAFCFKSMLNDLSVEEIDELWENLSGVVIERLGAICKPGENKSPEQPNKKICLDVSLIIQAAIDIAFVIFGQKMAASRGLLHMIVFLNRVIFDIPSNLESLKNSIALLCEKMFHMNYLDKDHELITFNTVIYLLKRSLYAKATKKDVKRIYALRCIIPKLMNMGDVDSNEIWSLLKRCATSTLYLSMHEGQKLITLAITIDADQVSEVHEAIKSRLPSCSLTQGSSYGKVYFDAWTYAVKTNSQVLKNEIEITCLQDLVLFAINEKQKQSVQVLRKLLIQFNSQKKDACVAKMLYFLYQPILWRFLKHPDGLVRANATQLFLDVFPLEDPDVKIVTTDQELNDQMLMIKDLLLDDFPIVRSAAVIGLCIGMSLHWELFPEDMLKTYFKIIVNELSCDSSSIEVRCAVAKGFKVLLENPMTIQTLVTVLPRLKGLFHDVADSVRIAFCQLLLRVKRISDIKYYNVVPLNHLLARMEEDPAVSKAIVNLIHNSYFPKAEGPESWLTRCLEMVKADRGASRVFFQYISNFVGLEATAKFMIQAVKSVHFYVKSKASLSKPAKGRRRSSKVPSEVEKLEQAVGFHDPNVVSGLLDAVAIMWLSCLNNLEKPENKDILKMIVSRLAKCLGDLSLYYKDTPVWQSVYYLSSFMPSRSIPSLASLCFLRLKMLNEDASSEEYMTLLECLCNQNEGPNLLTTVSEWIEGGFSKPIHTPSVKKRKTKQSTIDVSEEMNTPKPCLGVQILNDLLDHKSCQKVLLTRHPDNLKDFLKFVDEIKRKVELSLEKKLPQHECDFLQKLLFALLKIAVLLQGEDKCNSVKFVEELILWVQTKIVKPITMDNSISLSSTRSNLSASSTRSSLNTTSTRKNTSIRSKQSPSYERFIIAICKDLCTIMTDMTLIGFLNTKSLKYIKFALKLLSLGGELLLPVCKLLFKHITYGIYLILESKEENILRIVPDCFNKIFQCLGDEEFLQSIPSSEEKDIQALLAGAIQQMQPYNMLKELVSSILSSLTKHTLNSIINTIDSWQEFEKECDPFSNILITRPTSFMLSVICMKPKLIVYFLQHVQKYLSVQGKNLQSWVACYVIVMNIREIKHMSKSISKELHTLVDKMEGLLLEHHPLQAVDTNITLSQEEENHKKNKECSFEEHCQAEYQKLKKLLLESPNEI